MASSKFVVSLDFELFWGVRDKLLISEYYDNLSGTESAIESILTAFRKNGIRATWATVGLLMCENIEDMKHYSPNLRPLYIDKELSPYEYLSKGWSKDENSFHMVRDVVKKISKVEGQAIATHTFSHYYALEDGQSLEQFDADISQAIVLARTLSLDITSIVFPRNQYNKSYNEVLLKHGVKAYRGNESSWIYKGAAGKDESIVKRFARLLDSYINISGSNTFKISQDESYPLNLPSSRFLRPYNNKLSFIEWLRLRRVKQSMTYAAKNNEVFHLWWHPHNFGANQDKNLSFLNEVLKHFKVLEKKYGMVSCNMEDLIMAHEGITSEV